MLKLRVGADTTIFGLTDQDIDALRQERALRVDGAQLGLPGRRFIFVWGPNTESILTTLATFGVKVLRKD